MQDAKEPAPDAAASSLGHNPKGPKWEFDSTVADVFDDMLARSIPQYEVMRRAVFDIGSTFVQPRTDIVDLGCSRGEALAPYVDAFGAYNRYIGVEVSQPMLQAARARFEGFISAGVVDIRECDLRRDFPPCNASLVLSVLTLQFTPIEYRREIVEKVHRHLIPGGGFILVEKVNGRTARLHEMMEGIYFRHKQEKGYTREEIDRKKLSLEGVLVPLDASQNYTMLKESGFKGVECFWRWMNFAGWVAVK